MFKPLIALVAFAVVVAACGGSGGDGVASLEEPSDDGVVIEEIGLAAEASDEESILAFAQCMRDNGIEGFEDPDVTADGSLDFRRGQGQLGDIDGETLRDAFRACRENLDGLAFGHENFDRSEIEDRLVEFSICMRDPNRGNLPGFPDPDFSDTGPGHGGGGGSFGEDGLDRNDPAVQDALEACQEVFGGFHFGGPGGPDGPGGHGPGDGDGTSA